MVAALVVVAVIVVLLGGLIAFGARSVAGQREKLAAFRAGGTAYLCLPELGQLGPGMWVVAVDARDVALWKGWGGRRDAATSFVKHGAVAEPAKVRVNAARTVDGVQITGADGSRIAVVLYPDPTLRRTKPITGPELDAATSNLNRALGTGVVTKEQPELTVADAEAWRSWLGEHHADPAGVWLRLAKKGTTEPTTLTYAQALDEALCHGWIDGQTRRHDERTYWQRFTPRRARSPWSARNTTLIERLTAEGRMQPSGHAEVERAKADGRWDAAYAGQSAMEVPVDLAEAVAARPEAQAMFDILTRQNRFALLYRLQSAKRADTRARRIEQFVEMLARRETIYPQKRT